MKNRLAKLLLLPVILIATNSIAQESGYVVGKVLDETNQPLEFATIKVLSKTDSSLITGVSSSETGDYVLEKVPFGDYLLKTTFFGYNASFEVLTLSKESPFVKKEPIQLSQSSVLTGVEGLGSAVRVSSNVVTFIHPPITSV